MAFGNATFSDAAGAVGDLFAAEGDRFKAQGDRIESQNYDLAATYADQNVAFTKTSTEIKQAQLDRENYKVIGGQQADVAGAGFAASGSAIDLMRDSAQQGALTKAVGEQQGLITEAGYEQQAASDRNMSKAAQLAAQAEDNAATGAEITGAIKGVASIATLFV